MDRQDLSENYLIENNPVSLFSAAMEKKRVKSEARLP
jgi:hypothetical protein